jgi:plasmid stabilization system protein ParE
VTTLIIARRADTQIRAIEAWWAANREKAPDLFANELVAALRLIVTTPDAGQPYGTFAALAVRRVLLARSLYHVYFSYDVGADVVKVRAVWHARRGRGPALR